MTDGVIAGTGNSRKLKSIPTFLTAYPNYEAFAAALIVGTLPIDLNGINAAGWTTIGTLLAKANLLSDATCTALEIPTTSVPNDALSKLSSAALHQSVGTRAVTTMGNIAVGQLIKVGTLILRKVATGYHAVNSVTLQSTVTQSTYFLMDSASTYNGSPADTYSTTFYNNLPTNLKTLCMSVTLSDVSLTRYAFCLSMAELNSGMTYFNSNARRKLSTPDNYFTRTLYMFGSGIYLWYYIDGAGTITYPGSAGYTATVAPAIVIPSTTPAYQDADGYFYLDQAYNHSLLDMTGAEFTLPYAKIVIGSYTGTGTYGSGSPNSVIAPFKPKLMVILPTDAGNNQKLIGVIIPVESSNFSVCGTNTNFPLDSSQYSFSLLYGKLVGNTISWYNTNNSLYQLNAYTYLYAIIG